MTKQFFMLQLMIEPAEGIELDPDYLETVVEQVVDNCTAKEAIATGLDGVFGDLITDIGLHAALYVR